MLGTESNEPYTIKDIFKDELKKMLNVGFIYPILYSELVFPLVIIPNKNGKYRIFVEYRELNKATRKYYFPLPFIDSVINFLVGKKFPFWMDLVGTKDSKLVLWISKWLLSHFHGGIFITNFFHLAYVIPIPPWKGLSCVRYLILCMTRWKSTWMILKSMGMICKSVSQI